MIKKSKHTLLIVAILLVAASIPGLAGISYTQGLAATPPPTPTPNTAGTQPLGPDQFPSGVNPLTGLPVSDPSLLSLPPAMISVTNFPVSARPQAGLSYASYVFELFIGKGMTRYLALFYGEYPKQMPASDGGSALATDKAAIGPIRSGRLPYQTLRTLYNGFLVMASASSEVRSQLSNSTNIFGSDTDNINSALIDVTRLESIARANVTKKSQNLTGNQFSPNPPAGGEDAPSLWVFYNFYNQILWEYDPTSGAYLRSQDKADGSGKFYPSTDRLTGEQLAFENVIVFVVEHKPLNGDRTLIDLDMLYTRNKAFLFRDGKVFPIYWSTVNGAYEKKTGQMRPVRFENAQGEPFPLKPGNTWVEIVDLSTTLTEPQPGHWKARFYAP